jgi:biopolymer transport protein ExbD
MRFHRHRRPPSLTMDMTPMIDVTFQLIIFFMTVNQQSYLESEPLLLPQLKGSADQPQTALTINLTHDDRILAAGVPLTLDQLQARVKQEIARQGRADAVNIVLRVDRRSNTSALVNRVMLLLRQAGIRQSRIAVEAPEGGSTP